MVRQRSRGGFMSSKGRRSRMGKAVPTLPSSNFSTATGFDSSPSKTDEMKMRATEITGGGRQHTFAYAHLYVHTVLRFL